MVGSKAYLVTVAYVDFSFSVRQIIFIAHRTITPFKQSIQAFIAKSTHKFQMVNVLTFAYLTERLNAQSFLVTNTIDGLHPVCVGAIISSVIIELSSTANDWLAVSPA